jgi:hypothetical protein
MRPKPGIPGVSGKLCQIWICVASQEALGSLVLDERVVAEPSDGAAHVAEGLPRWQQVRILLAKSVSDAAEGPLALDDSCQPAPGPFIGGRVVSSCGGTRRWRRWNRRVW